MKPAVFADAFYWIALTNPADAARDDAQTLDQSLTGLTILTTDEVPNDGHFEQEGFRALFRS